MAAFAAALARASGQPLADPAALQAWSVREWRAFWRFFLAWSGLLRGTEGEAEPVCVFDTGEGVLEAGSEADPADACERARFFPRLRLNWADRLLDLGVAPPDQPALVACHADGGREAWSRGALRARVAQLADALDGQGLAPGDRVVAVLRHDADAAALALAVAAVGATLATASPEMGLEALAERFAPLEPRWLLAHLLPRAHDAGSALDDKVEALARQLPSLHTLVGLDASPPRGPWQGWTLEGLAATGRAARFAWPRHPFNHPLFILFSSGTTGRPKAIVHGAGGTLLEHLKEHRLHCDLRPGERLYFHTSCSWMMWQWQLAALASGVTLVAYDGPVHEAETLWALVARERVHVFGTSPAYLRLGQACGLSPAREFDLRHLRAILSTGAILQDTQFDWVAREVGPVALQSICGGTDILGCFVLGHPDLPVLRGQAQCRSLALDVQAWGDEKDSAGGRPLPPGAVGQLVCVNPFPSRPLGFHGDEGGRRFHAAYFAQNPGVWTHGDLIEFGPEGGARLHGRSDGLLNVRGIKLAPAEIARALQDEPQVAEVMVVEQSGDPPQVLALVVAADRGGLAPGGLAPAGLEAPTEGHEAAALIARMRRTLAQRLSPAHLPDRFLLVPALPATHNGKPSEAAARAAVNGLPAPNRQALRNPQVLEAIEKAATRPATREEREGGVDSEGREGLETGGVIEGRDACGVSDALDLRDGSSLLLRVQAIWTEVLGLPEVGLDDHFLDLGGTSLHAAMIVSRLRRAAGCRLPLASLLRAPTVRQLAALALQSQGAVPTGTGEGEGEGEGVATRTGTGTRTGLYMNATSDLNTGPIGAAGGETLWVDLRPGAGRPLVLVHGLSGTVMECWPLVRALRSARPVAGLQARGLDGGAWPPASVEAIAAEYVEVLRQAQPQGPYALCGYSFGGLVALEMGRALRARGEQVELLCLVDPYLRRGLPAWRRAWLRARGALGRWMQMDAVAWRDYLAHRIGRRPAGDGIPPGLTPPQRAVYASHLRSMEAYAPPPYDASPVLFVRAREPLAGYFDPSSVWRRLLRGPLRVHTLPGGHLDLVRAEAARLAALLDQALEGLMEQPPEDRPESGAALRPAGGSPSPARLRSSSPG